LARRIPMTWFCEMANSVIGENGEMLEYHHLIANHKTRSTWLHSYGNELGRLAQGMPGQNTGINTIFFIKKNQVPQDRAKDVTYGLITTLIRPEKMNKPNRTRLVTGSDGVHYPGDAGTPTRPTHRQAPPQKHYQHTKCKIHDYGHQGLLPQHSNGMV
jgi:hypothetical protein